MGLFALIGHCVLWVSFWNYVNGSGWTRPTIKWISRALFAGCGLVPPIVLSVFLNGEIGTFVKIYFAYCFAVTIVTLPWEYWRRRKAAGTNRLQREVTRIHRLPATRLESLKSTTGLKRWLLNSRLNQSFEIEEVEKHINLSRLDSRLNGFTVAHITDLHFTGKVSRSFFDAAIDIVNQMKPDLIAITGDLVDDPECNTWLAKTLGRLRAKHGVYFILGNHDGKQDRDVIRRILTDCGLKDVSQKTHRISIDGYDVFLAGDETPWGPSVVDADLIPSRQLIPHARILLAHSPDSIQLANDNDFDLMLAGHTHGGQFCVPGYGAVVCPMQTSLELASGTFYIEPTLLHVNRGLSAELPLRINCRPEVTKLVFECTTPRPPVTNHDTSTGTSTKRLPRMQSHLPEIKKADAAHCVES